MLHQCKHLLHVSFCLRVLDLCLYFFDLVKNIGILEGKQIIEHELD